MSNISPNSPIQNIKELVTQSKLDKTGFDSWKQNALQDQKLDRDEAQFLMDQLATGNVEKDLIPAVTTLLSEGFSAHTANPVARIGGHELPLHAVSKDFTLETARSITDENGVDEVYFKDEDGKLFVAYGDIATKGALDLDRIKQNYITRVDGKKMTVVHINNETNTTWEGAKAPWKSSLKTLRDAGQTGVVKGIGEMATAVTAMFIGKTVLENGIKKVSSSAAEKTLEAVATKAAETVAVEAAEKTIGVVGQVKTLGTSIGGSIKSSLRSVVVGGAVAGVVVGAVVGVGSAIGAVKSNLSDRDYTTLDMITGHY